MYYHEELLVISVSWVWELRLRESGTWQEAEFNSEDSSKETLIKTPYRAEAEIREPTNDVEALETAVLVNYYHP